MSIPGRRAIDADKMLPFDKAAEEGVIATALVDSAQLPVLAAIVQPEHFYRDVNRWAWEAVLAVWRRGEVANQITVAHELANTGRLVDVGGVTYLSRLTTELPTTVGAPFYARIVREDARRRELIGLGAEIVKDAHAGGPDSNALSRRALDRLNTMTAGVVDGNARGAVTVRVADVERENVRWLWSGRIPHGRLTALIGDPGVGKSWLTLAVATAVTLGKPLPGDHTSREPAGVLVMTAEDGLADTVRPRLEDMGADLTRVHVLTATHDKEGRERFPSLVDDLAALDAELERGGYALLIVDPVNAYLGSSLDSHRDAAIRSVLGPLAQIAERHGVAVMFTLHLTKSSRDRAIYRGQGSIGYSAAARVVLLAGQDPENPQSRALCWVKGNLSAPAATIAYEISAGQFYWRGESDLTAGQLLAPDADTGAKSARQEAVAFLTDVLSDDPRPAKEVQAEATEAGISRRSLWDAKDALGVKVTRKGEPGKRGGGAWFWTLLDGVKDAGADLEYQDSHSVFLISLTPSVSRDALDGPEVDTLNQGSGQQPDADTLPDSCSVCGRPVVAYTAGGQPRCAVHYVRPTNGRLAPVPVWDLCCDDDANPPDDFRVVQSVVTP